MDYKGKGIGGIRVPMILPKTTRNYYREYQGYQRLPLKIPRLPETTTENDKDYHPLGIHVDQ